MQQTQKLITRIKKYNSNEEYPFGVSSENVIVDLNNNKKTSLQTVVNYLTNFFNNINLIYSSNSEDAPKNSQIKIWLDTRVQQPITQ